MVAEVSSIDIWQRRQFSEIAESVVDRIDDPPSSGLDYYIGLEHLDPDTLTISRWGSPADVESTKLRFLPGDVIYARRRAYQRKLGVANWEGIASAHALVLRACPDVCLPEFLPYFLQADQFHGRALDISVGSLSPTINWKTLSSETFLLPNRAVQGEISGTMEGFENYIGALVHTMESARKLEEAIVNEVSRESPSITLGELASNGGIQIGPFGSQLHAHEYVDEGIPVVMPADLGMYGLRYDRLRMVTEETAERLAKHRVRTGDILLPRRGDLNKRALVDESEAGWLCGTGSVRVRLDDAGDAPLVVGLLCSASVVQWLEMNAVGTTMPNLNADIVSRIPISMPEADKRHEYASLLSSISELSIALDAVLTSARHARMAALNDLLETPSDL